MANFVWSLPDPRTQARRWLCVHGALALHGYGRRVLRYVLRYRWVHPRSRVGQLRALRSAHRRAGAGLVRYNTTSDAEFKNIHGDADRQKSFDLVMGARLRSYSWKDDPTNKIQIGLIAQEEYQRFKGSVSVGGHYEKEIPAVTEQVLIKEETYDPETGEKIPAQYETVEVEPARTEKRYAPWAVDKTAYVWHLVATCQKQQQLIDDLTARIEALEAK